MGRPIGLMDARDPLVVLTGLASLGVVAWLGLDAWIVGVWAVSLVAGAVIFVLTRLLMREFGASDKPAALARRSHSGLWMAGAVAAFVSCTMAAALVRSQAPGRDFWILGVLMLLAVVDLRLAYTGPRARRSRGQQP